jgi:hypothetical protein
MRALKAVLIAGALAAAAPLAGSVYGPRAAAAPAVDPVASAPVKARARILGVFRAGQVTKVRFGVDQGAARVTVRLWRSVPQIGRLPLWVAATPLRDVGPAGGVRTAVLSRVRLRAGLYQVRVTVTSQGGIAIATVRYQAPRLR